MKPAASIGGHLEGGTLHFPCPQCSSMRAVPAWMAGMKLRAPCCGAAISAADPGHGARARTYEKDVESVLHPERFVPPTELARKFRTSGVCIAAAVTGALLAGWQGLAIADQGITGRIDRFSNAPATSESTPATHPAAATVVREFLSADGAAAKARFVKSPDTVQPLMVGFFEKFGGGAPAEVTAVTCSAPGVSTESPDGLPVIHAVADLRDGSHQCFTLEVTPAGPLIDWTASTGWSGTEFRDLLASPGLSRHMHVLAREDDYFPSPMAEGRDICVRITDPRTGLETGYAYAPAESPEGWLLRQALAGRKRLVRLTLSLRSTEELAPARGVLIEAFHHAGFRAPAAASF